MFPKCLWTTPISDVGSFLDWYVTACTVENLFQNEKAYTFNPLTLTLKIQLLAVCCWPFRPWWELHAVKAIDGERPLPSSQRSWGCSLDLDILRSTSQTASAGQEHRWLPVLVSHWGAVLLDTKPFRVFVTQGPDLSTQVKGVHRHLNSRAS